MRYQTRLVKVLCLFLSLLALGCTKDSEESSSPSPAVGDGRRSDCGVVIDGKLHNPPSSSAAIEGQISQVVDAEFVIFRPNDPSLGSVLVKTLAAQQTKKSGAASYIKEVLPSGSAAQLFSAGNDCDVTTAEGGRGILGTIMLSDGRILTEQLLKNGFLLPDSSTSYCSKRLVENCYQALAEQAPKEPEVSPYSISYFLWKPVSDKDGKLVIHFNPYASKLTVNGSALQYTGYGNGRASTFRSGQPGCAFGRATIKAWDRNGLPLQWPGGKTEYVIANGCQRVTF